MIAIVNNCLHIMELAKQMRTRYLNNDDNRAVGKSFESLLMTYEVSEYFLFLSFDIFDESCSAS